MLWNFNYEIYNKNITMGTKKYFALFYSLLFINIAAAKSPEYNRFIGRFDQEGFYIGFGSGINITNNSNLIKTFEIETQMKVTNMGSLSGYSVPVFFYGGYRFNPYLSTEISYTYSGNQNYTAPNDCVNCSDFWGSQNNFGVSAVGYLPIKNWVYLKARLGLAYNTSSFTTYIGDPGTKNITSITGLGIDYPIIKNLGISFDYINYGLLIPIQLQYQSPQGGPNLGVIDTQQSHLFLFNLKVTF